MPEVTFQRRGGSRARRYWGKVHRGIKNFKRRRRARRKASMGFAKLEDDIEMGVRSICQMLVMLTNVMVHVHSSPYFYVCNLCESIFRFSHSAVLCMFMSYSGLLGFSTILHDL